MFVDDYTMQRSGAETHSKYVADSNAYRAIQAATRANRELTGSAEVSPGALERLGAVMIALGRRLCERRGSMHVEVEFRMSPSHSGGNGRNVA